MTTLGRFRYVVGVAWRIQRAQTLLVLALIILDSVAGGALAFAMRAIVDAVVDSNDTRAWIAAAVAIATTSWLVAGSRFRIAFQTLVSQNVAAAVDRDLLEIVAGTPGIEHFERPEYLDRVKLVAGQGRAMADATFALVTAASYIVRLVISVWLLAAVDPALILLPVFAVPSVLLAPRSRRLVEQGRSAVAEATRAEDHLHALFFDPSAAKELRVFGADAYLDERTASLDAHVTRMALGYGLRASALSLVGWATFGCGYAAALALVVDRTIHGAVSVGAVVLVTQLALQLRGQVAGTVSNIQGLSAGMAMLERVEWLREYSAEITQRQGQEPAPTQLDTGIELRDVSFTYPGTDTEVLHDISLRIPAGSTIALVGENGAGKTTLVKLLCGLYRASAGAVLVDDQDLGVIDPNEWQQRLTACFQDFARYELLAHEGVGLGHLPDIDNLEAVGAAVARADATDVVDRLPEGLMSPLGRRHWNGTELSGGQWQKLALARTVMRTQPLLLVLDEPTAALDAPSEHALFERYANAAAGAARDAGAITVLVSHRFSTVRMADHIVVLEAGRIREHGTHDSLMQNAGLYAELYGLQARAYQ